MSEQMPEELQNIIDFMQEMIDDNTVPQSVRGKLSTIIDNLKDTSCDLAIRINKVQDDLDEISNDTNIPSYARTDIINIASMLEIIQ